MNWELLLLGLKLDDVGSAKLEAVGSTMMSGNPLEGVLEVVVSSVVGSNSSLVVVGSGSSLVVVEEVVKGVELGAVGSTIVSGRPVDGCVDSAGVVGCTMLSGNPCEGTSEVVAGKPSSNEFWLSPPNGFSSLPSNWFSSSPDELVVAGALEVVDEAGRDEEVSVFVIVTVCVPVSPGNVGSMVVTCSVWPGVSQGSSALKLERNGAQSK